MRSDQLDKAVFKVIANKRKLFFIINFFSVVLFGGLTFPINSLNDFMFSVSMLIVYFYLGFIFCGLYDKKPLVVFFSTFILNLLGLTWRVLLEWGEHALTRDLTVLNVGIHLIFIPLYITLIYLTVQQLKNKKKH